MPIKVLLIDDDVNWCEEIKIFLEERSFNIATETDIDKAIDTLNEVVPDIVILDISFGPPTDKRGLEVCRKIRQLPQYKRRKLGIIVICGQPDKLEYWRIVYHQGADRFLLKPFEPIILLEEISVLNSLIAPPNVLQIDDRLTIHFNDRFVKLDGKLVELAPLEFDVLAYLAKPPEKPRSRAEILQAVWNVDPKYTDPAVVTLYISRIRDSLSLEDRQRYIKTLSGAGYMLSQDG